jgi:hypothetical protein
MHEDSVQVVCESSPLISIMHEDTAQVVAKAAHSSCMRILAKLLRKLPTIIMHGGFCPDCCKSCQLIMRDDSGGRDEGEGSAMNRSIWPSASCVIMLL